MDFISLYTEVLSGRGKIGAGHRVRQAATMAGLI